MSRLTTIGVAAILAFSASSALATTHTLTLTGDLNTATSVTFPVGTDTLQQASVTLTGFIPFTLNSGDSIDWTVSFTGLMFGNPLLPYFAMPAASGGPFGQLMGINFFRADGTEPVDASATSSVAAILSGAVGDLTGLSLTGGCSNCLTPIMGRSPGPFGAFGFTGIAGIHDVALTGSYEVDSINFTYQVQLGQNAVIPEPASWAMLIAGFGLVGALRRRQRATVSA